MSHKNFSFVSVLVGALLLAPNSRSLAQTQSESQIVFLRLYEVARSPRCVNCHSAGNAPLQTDAGIIHSMNITRNLDRVGLKCVSCHSASGTNERFLPPSAPNWRMPSAQKALAANMTPKYLCALWKSGATGIEVDGKIVSKGRDLDQMLKHISEDALVRWSWNPGAHRTKPPGTQEEFVADFKRWKDTGAQCPSGDFRD